MPILDGLAVCRAIRADSTLDQVRIIIISAHASASEAQAAGADRYIPKPLRPLRLLAAIDEVVAERQLAGRIVRPTRGAGLLDAG